MKAHQARRRPIESQLGKPHVEKPPPIPPVVIPREQVRAYRKRHQKRNRKERCIPLSRGWATKLQGELLSKRTEFEIELQVWLELAGERVEPQHFMLGRYFADLYLPARRLVVELDGGHHFTSHAARDAERNSEMNRFGFAVLRIPNRCCARSELGRILKAIKSLSNSGTTFHFRR